jgi:ATP-dependent Clp protease ATP-binding subunit ClpA
MFQRFTERARMIVPRARERALAGGYESIEPAHLAAALLDDPKSHATTALAALGHEPDALRSAVEASCPDAGEPVEREGKLSFTPAVRRVFEASLEAAALVDSAYIGTEHLLLGLLGLPDVPAAAALLDAGVSPDAVRGEIEKARQKRPTGWRPGFDLGKVCAAAMGLVTEAGLDRVGRAAMVAALLAEIDPATERALRSVGVDPSALLDALRREIRRDAES